MKFASIGTPAASRSRRDGRKGQAGFTLLEALVSLALILAFAGSTWSAFVAGAPHHGPCRRPRGGASSAALAARCAIRSLRRWQTLSRKGETGELRWRIVAEPVRRCAPRAPDQPRWHAISRDRKCGVGLRSGHYRRNDTARQAGAMKMQTEPNARRM